MVSETRSEMRLEAWLGEAERMPTSDWLVLVVDEEESCLLLG